MAERTTIQGFEFETYDLSAYERLLLPEYEAARQFYEHYCCPLHFEPPKGEIEGQRVEFDQVVSCGMVFDEDHVVALLSNDRINPSFLLLTYPRVDNKKYDEGEIIAHPVYGVDFSLDPVIGREQPRLTVRAQSGYDGRDFRLSLTSHGNTWQYDRSRTQFPFDLIQAPADIINEFEEIRHESDLVTSRPVMSKQHPRCLDI